MNAIGVCLALGLTGCDTLHYMKTDYQSSQEFDRKARCETYASKTEQEFREATRELGNKNDILFSVERIFYSSKRNSCVCLLRESSVVLNKRFEEIQTLDVLTKEDLGSKSYSGNQLDNLSKDVDAQVKSLE
jgi:hypothetical protein